MTGEPHSVVQARERADEARARLVESFDDILERLEQLQQQLTPSHLMRDAWEAAKGKGADLAEDAVDAVASRPMAVSGAVAAVALFLAREPLLELAGKLAGSVTGKGAAKRKRKAKKKQTNVETIQ